jgi:hypothetical protein
MTYATINSLWDIIKNLSYAKKEVKDEDIEKYYDSYIINKYFSLFPDTLFYSEQMNVSNTLSRKLQHDFYLYSIPKSNRYKKIEKKWAKNENIKLFCDYFKCSTQKAYQYNLIYEKLNILDDIIIDMKKSLYTGGFS